MSIEANSMTKTRIVVIQSKTFFFLMREKYAKYFAGKYEYYTFV